jgi:hypothetical protein
MGTPARGSQIARTIARFGPARRMLGQVGARDLLQGLPGRWPFAPQLGIISGTGASGIGRLVARIDGPNDGTVSVAETRLDGATDCCSLPVSHAGMWLSSVAVGKVADFLESGCFD